MNNEITDKIGKALDGILQGKSDIAQNELLIQNKNQSKITIDRSKTIKVSDLDLNEAIDKEIRTLEKQIKTDKEKIQQSKAALYNVVSAYEGCELSMDYENEPRTLRVRKIMDDLYKEGSEEYEVIYNGENYN